MTVTHEASASGGALDHHHIWPDRRASFLLKRVVRCQAYAKCLVDIFIGGGARPGRDRAAAGRRVSQTKRRVQVEVVVDRALPAVPCRVGISTACNRKMDGEWKKPAGQRRRYVRYPAAGRPGPICSCPPWPCTASCDRF